MVQLCQIKKKEKVRRMSKIHNEWPTKSREAMLYRSALAASAKKSGLNAVKFEERGIPYEDVYRSSSQELAKENAARFRIGRASCRERV